MFALAHFSKPVQWAFALLMALLCFAALGFCYVLPILDWRWLPVLFLAIPFFAPLESLLLTPLYTLLGRFHYYSPMLLATKRNSGGLDLHAGTVFDYLMRLRWRDRGRRAACIVTADLLYGLLAIIDDVVQENLPPDTTLVATSYFFSKRSLDRLGFQQSTPQGAVVLNLYMASLSIALRLSFTRGRFSFPDLPQIRQATTMAGKLVQHRSEIMQMLHRLQA